MIRIDEILRAGIESGQKFTLADMGAIQQDVVDIIVARRMTPKIILISQEVLHHLTKEQRSSLQEMLLILEEWPGSFEETSVGASLYTRWYI